MRILIFVTHLLGIGHLKRAVHLKTILASTGFEVALLSGGNGDADGALIDYQLPPVHCKLGDFNQLYDDKNQPVSADYLANRINFIENTIDSFQPNILITELFPFGRRQLKDEFLTALKLAKHQYNCINLSSVRDILQIPKKSASIHMARDIFSNYYDGVLVHGEPNLTEFDQQWGINRQRIHYTGYLPPINSQKARNDDPKKQIIVISAGNSTAGAELYQLCARVSHNLVQYQFHFLLSKAFGGEGLNSIKKIAHPSAICAFNNEQFLDLLSECQLSISMAGYNSLMDLAQTGAKNLVYPFDDFGETEQAKRAQIWQEKGFTRIIPKDCSAELLKNMIMDTIESPQPKPIFTLDSKVETLAIIQKIKDYRAESDEIWQKIKNNQHRINLWWRDDDAIAATDQLVQLVQLAKKFKQTIYLAVIPAQLESSLVEYCQKNRDSIIVIQHGYNHTSHIPKGQGKKSEFMGRELGKMRDEITAGFKILKDQFGDQFCPIFVPPWNRIDADLIDELPAMGLKTLSTFHGNYQQGLHQTQFFDCQVDFIDWKSGGILRDPLKILRKIDKILDESPNAPIDLGILTHHLVHNQEIWYYLDGFLDRWYE